jgi:inner membrane protein YidH
MSPGTELSLDRTFMAQDRTLMAWVRTSTSLISFGFTIYKFFQYLIETGTVFRIHKVFGPREFAIIMISIGVCALGVAVLEYSQESKKLEQIYGKKHRSFVNKLALIVFILGLGLLSLVLLHQ